MISRRIFRQLWCGIGVCAMLLMASPASAQRGGFGFSIGGGGGGHGGYHSSGTQWGVGVSPYGVGWGAGIPLGNGDVRIGVGNYGYGNSPYYRHAYWYDHGYYHGNDYYSRPYYGSYSNDYTDGDQYVPAAAQEPPPLPTAGQLARLNDGQLRQILADAAEGYRQELDGFTTGESWKKHFQLAEVLDYVGKNESGPLNAKTRKLLGGVLSKMDSVSKNTAYAMIAKPYGFRLMQAALREYTLPAAVRQGHLLGAQVQTLKLSLDGLTTGESWKKHLELDSLENVADNLHSGDPAAAGRLEKILAKFDAAVKKPQYKIIAEQEGFQSVQASLQNLINALREETPKHEAPPPPAAVP
jgi:hypothetical protein